VGTSIYDYLQYGWQMVNGFRTNGEVRLFKERLNDIASAIELNADSRILDLGNGYLRPQYSLLQASGYRVVGIDLVNQPDWGWIKLMYLIARGLYRWKLGLPLKDVNRGLICGDVNYLPFRNESFDLVTSIAAFEHFLDVRTVIAESYRILRPGGIVYVRIHPFTCPSGGHNVRMAEIPLRSLPQGVDAWDHLRKKRLPFHVPLNKWRQREYLSTFTQRFEILNHYCAMREGEQLLTQDIEDELSEYSRDELTCGAYVIVARKAAVFGGEVNSIKQHGH
jgi:ubiquinone/menaquinone biosynthesis C-methylase UbiE